MGVAQTIEPEVEAQTIDETVPLLANANDIPTPTINRASRRRVFIALLVMICVLDLGAQLGASPMTEIFENIICWNYYNDQSKNPSKILDTTGYNCKIEPVQSELAFVNGWMDSFQFVVSIIFTLPFGALADRTSRRFVIGLAITGLTCFELFVRIVCWFPHIFPIRLVWGGAFFMCIGGGAQVALALCYAIVAEYITPEERSNVFMRMNGITLLVEIIASYLSAALMKKNPWIPFLLSIPLEIASVPLLLLVPPEKRGEQETPPEPNPLKLGAWSDRAAKSMNTAYRFVMDNILVFVLTLPWLTTFLSRHPFLLIYAAKKFNTTFADATFLVNVRSIMSLLIYVVVLPFVNNLLSQRYHFNALRRDLLVTRTTAVILLIGALIVAMAPNIPIFLIGVIGFGLGTPFAVALRCVVTHLVPAEALGTLYTSIGLIQSVGLMCQGPLVAALFKHGLKVGVMGLPYYVIAGFMAANVAIVLLTPVAQDQIEAGGPGDDDGEPQS